MKSYLGSALLLLCLGSLVQAEETDRVLARWRGGELRESLYQSRYVAGKKELSGDSFKAAICKASFQEIYGDLAHKVELDRSPEYRSEMESWRRDFLAGSWRGREEAELAKTLSAAELAAEWQEVSAPGAEFDPSQRADVDILYLPCGLRPAARQACRDEAAGLDRRLAAGEAFGRLAMEQREKGGRANGHFQDISLAILSADLRGLIEATPEAQISPWLEAPHGLFRLQLLRRRDGKKFEMAAFEPRLRETLLAAKVDARVQAERARLGLGAEVADVDVMAAAARRLGLDREDGFARNEAEHSRWWLADHAFLADRASMPSDEELMTALRARHDVFEEVELEVLLLDVTEHQATLDLAGEIEELLATSKGKKVQELFEELPSRFPTLRREQLGPLRLLKLGKVLPEFEKPLSSLEEGGWRGPIPLAEKDLAQAIAAEEAKRTRHSGYEVLAFVRMAHRGLPPLDAARPELYREERGKLGTGPAYFVSVLEKRWGFELLPAESPKKEDAKP